MIAYDGISNYIQTKDFNTLSPGQGNLYFGLDIILVKELSKHPKHVYFPGTKIDPADVLYGFINLPVMSFSIYVNLTKTYHFPNFSSFSPQKMYARTPSGPEKQPLLRDFLYEDDIQLQIQVTYGSVSVSV